ncbi:YbhB/YbcL family Raf kinase inhibitor-like protein [Actinoplanes friuliensis]|uniref:PEBP family protein n=1 Tax=Actinoplanes friuliensis DSM 7358 TaxID=1246995 RepID=U5W122_9ACTN|nr:YbhB/YbcL family Raf kinase inhibitor-like protein [Actinoplanes friuliensis]AGZ42712.1 hypothetical protein AFR_22210 [Actinoplanes friuliensis DSM 7358]
MYDPYALAFPAAAFRLSSPDFTDGGPLPATALASGGNRPPVLYWNGLPAGTRSLVLTAFDADAPIPGGLWHWAVKDVQPVHGEHTTPLTNSLGVAGWSGANPPPGTGTHRMIFCATALDVAVLDVPEGASLALVQILMIPHTLGRGLLTGTSEAPPA